MSDVPTKFGRSTVSACSSLIDEYNVSTRGLKDIYLIRIKIIPFNTEAGLINKQENDFIVLNEWRKNGNNKRENGINTFYD